MQLQKSAAWSDVEAAESEEWGRGCRMDSHWLYPQLFGVHGMYGTGWWWLEH